MAANGQRLLCLEGINLDVAPQYLKATQARYVKNLYYQLSDLGDAGTAQGANTGVLKPLPSTELYVPFNLPPGDCHVIGTLPSRETNELYVFVFNSLSNHFIYRINGLTQTVDVGAPNPCFNFILDPRYFIGEGQAYLEVIYLTDTATGNQIVKKDIFWTDGFNYQGYLRFEDYLLTNGFDANTFNYFSGTYDKCSMVRMGLPTPNDCIKIDQVPFNPLTDSGKNNNIKSAGWQFRILRTDVFGRPSEHGIISDETFLSNNECFGSSDMLSRCWDLTFDAGNPLIDKIQVEYRNCNDEQWYLDSVLELYQGSNLGEWWTRPRNPDVVYNGTTNKITYTFCKDKLCDPIPVTETNRTQNDLPRKSEALTKIGRDIALADNTDGFPPFSRQDILDKISVEVIKPVPSTVGSTANITVYIRIYNPFRFTYQKVWKKDNTYAFGGIEDNIPITNIVSDYQQNFVIEGQQGYIGYLAGTNNFAIGVQYYLDGGVFVKDTDFNDNIDKQYFLKYEFNGVPKGSYIFRLASHLANPAVVDVKTTSTYVGGVWNFSNNNVGSQRTYFKEIQINACVNDYDTLTSGEILLAYDMTRPYRIIGNTVLSDDTVLDGYVYEAQDPLTKAYSIPVELLQMDVLHTGAHTFEYSVITDHNGFYFAGSIANPFRVQMNGYCNCVKTQLSIGDSGFNFQRYSKNVVLGNSSRDGYTTYCDQYETSPCSRVLIKGTVKLCGSGTGVPNINVVYSKGGLGVTNANGEFTIIAHDNSVTGFRTDQLFVMGGACAFTDCDSTCIDVKTVSFSSCTSCNERIVSAGNYSVLFITSKGLLSGGRYGVELTGYDWLGRHGFAQTIDKLYFNIPSLNETKTFAPSVVNLIIPNTVTFPDWVDYFTVGVTVELNYGGNYISWIADKVQFVDNSGNENNAAPTQIKIWYASLNEYNAQNNFNTTTGWQIVPTSETQPRTADVVQFLRNGDGTFFDNPINALVKYNQDGQYFLINYTDSLKGLKENALIRLANPQECANKDQFFELCGSYKVINGKAQVQKITLNAFDTYFQYRQIPVPVSLENGVTDANIIELRQFGFPFESPSITDFWGYKCWNRGRFNVRNPYEAELVHKDQIAISGALSVNAQLNFLNYFDESQKYDIIINNSGGIVAVIPKIGILLVVCQYTSFIMGFNDNRLIVNESGQVISPSAADKFGKPVNDSIAEYGCQFFDKSTIRQKEGFAMWLDRSRVAILQHNFSTCEDVSRYNTANSTIISWLTKKIKFQDDYNNANNNSRYFHSVIDPTNFTWIMSEFTIGSNDYVNTEREENVSKQETIVFAIAQKVWRMFASFTPQYMGYMENSPIGQLLFSFKNGMAHCHPTTTNTKLFNIFYDTPCERVYRFIFNTDGFKKKKFQAIESYSNDSRYWSDLIVTEAKQVSRLLKSQWKKADYFYFASFLCNIVNPLNNENAITENDNLFGTFCDVRFIGDPDGTYNELYGVIINAAGEENTG